MFSVTQSAVAQSVRLNVVSNKRSAKVRWVVVWSCVLVVVLVVFFSRISLSFKRAFVRWKRNPDGMMFSTSDDEKRDWLSRARVLSRVREKRTKEGTEDDCIERCFMRSFTHSFVQEEEHVFGREKPSSVLSTPAFVVHVACPVRDTSPKKTLIFEWFFGFFSLFGREFLDSKQHSLTPLSLPFTSLY